MFIHNFKYSFKTLFKNKMLIFWTFAFPIILGTLFNMAFSNLENGQKLNIVNIAIISNEDFENNKAFKTSFAELGDENNEDRLFNIQYTTEEEAKELLDNGEIAGFLKLEGNEPIVTVSASGIDETILKSVTEEILQTNDLIQNLSEVEKSASGNSSINSREFYSNILEVVSGNNVKLKNVSNSNLSYTVIEFYTLIAMACLYGGMLSITTINQTLPNMSNKGKRVAVAPTKKGNIILSSLFASYITQLIGLAILFVYTIFVLKVDYGNNTGLIILLAMAGSLAGLSLGTAVGTLFKKNENAKTGILVALTMLRLLFVWNDGNHNEVFC